MQNAGLIDVTNMVLEISGNTENSGTIRADGQGAVATFDSVTVDQINGGTFASIGGAQLYLNGATVNNGALTLDSGSTLDVELGTNSVTTLDGVSVTGTSANGDALTSTILLGATSTTTLLLEDGTTVTGGALTIDNSSELDIEAGQNGGGATLDGVTVTVTDGTIEVDGALLPTVTLTLDDGATIIGGQLRIGGIGVLDIEGGPQGPLGQGSPDATLDGVTLSNSGIINVDLHASGAILQLDDATTITGGQLTIGGNASSILDIEGGPQGVQGDGNPDATLDGVTVTNNGTIAVDLKASGAVLQLDDATTITGGNVTISSNGALNIDVGPDGNGGSNGENFDAALDGVTVTNDGTINVDLQDNGGAILYLEDGTTITGGNLVLADTGGGAEVYVQNGANSTFGATLDHVTVTINGNEIGIGGPIATGSVLNLVDGTVISGGASGSTLVLDGAADVVNVGVGSNANGATFDGITVDNNGTINVDPTASGVILTLDDGTIIRGGTLQTSANGAIDVIVGPDGTNGADATFDGSTNGLLFLDSGAQVVVGAGATLELQGHIQDAGSITLNGVSQGSDLVIAGNVTLDGGGHIDIASLGSQIRGNDSNDTLDNVNVSIHGEGGFIGGEALNITNELDGIISSNGGAGEPLTIFTNHGSSTGSGTLTNHGLVASIAGGGLEITGDVANDGTLEARAGLLKVDGDVTSSTSGAGQSLLDGGNMEFDGASNAQVQFFGSTADQLILGQNSSFTGTASGFSAGDSIDFVGLDPSAVHVNGQQITYGTSTFTVDNTSYSVVADGHGGAELEWSSAFGINQGPQTAAVADGATWYGTGHLTAHSPVNGDSLTWTIVGGSRYLPSNYQFGLHEFAVTKVVSGSPATVFDDTFGTVPPAGQPPILVGSSPSSVSLFTFGSSTFVQGTNEALINGSNAGYAGLANGIGSSYGAPVFGQFTTLLTGTSYNASAGDGLRSGQSFTTSGLFDLTTPADTFSRYGIRLSDRVSLSGANDQPGTEVVDLGVIRNSIGTASVVLSETNHENGVSTTLQVATINAPAGHTLSEYNEILLSLSNNAATNGQVTASYMLERLQGGVEVADSGPVKLGAVGRIFDNEDWARAQFYGFQTVTTTSAAPQADSILQGTYGELDLAQDGTWRYTLNDGLASVKALADGQVAYDNFTVQAAGTGGQATQTISVKVTGINDAPSATTPVAHYSVTPGGAALHLENTGLSVADVDGGNGVETATLSVGEGVITIAAGNSGVSNITGNGTGSVTFSGTLTQINALLGNSSGTILYTDNAAPSSSSTTLTLSINDNGNNGVNALSDSASATIDLGSGSNFGSQDWRHDINIFAATTGTFDATTGISKWSVPNRDGTTSTVFNGFVGSNFAYDPVTHLPTNGGIASIQLVDNASHTVLQQITNIAVTPGDFGNLIARLESIQDKISWAGLVDTNSDGPLSSTPTDIHFANTDGTFTDIIGTNFAQTGSQLSGTVTAVELKDALGNVLQTVNFSLSTSLSDVAAALFPDEASKQFYNLAGIGNGNTLTGFANGPVTNYNFTLDDSPGSHLFVGSPQTTYMVNFEDATSGVTVHLGAPGSANWGTGGGAHNDTLQNIENVQGSKLADIIVGDANGNFLDGGGAASGANDGLTGRGGSDTFAFRQGYGALTITDFDQGGGSFNQSENDLIQLNDFSGQGTASFVGNNTVIDFGGGDILTLNNVTQSEFTALAGTEFVNGNNNGGGNGGNGGGGNNGGPVLNAGAPIPAVYAGVPVALDFGMTVTDTTGTVSSVNVWISSGFHTGDTFSINGLQDGTIFDPDNTQIHYHFDNTTNPNSPSIFLSAFSGTPTAGDFNFAMQSIQFSPGAADGDRTISWAAYDNVVHSPTVTTTVQVGPVMNGFGVTLHQGETVGLVASNFASSDPGFSNLTYSVHNVVGGQFEVDSGGGFVPAPTGGFTTTDIAAGHVEFVQDGTSTVPGLMIHVSDTSNASPDIPSRISLEIAGASSETIAFGGPAGALMLDNPSSFTGQIAGINSPGNVLDLHGFNWLTTHASTGSGSYDSASNTTTLTVTDSSNGGQTETFKLVADYSNVPAQPAFDDHNGGATISLTTPGQTIVATGQNQTLSGGPIGNDNFVFNTATIGHDFVTNYHPNSDLIQFNSAVFATAQAVLDATNDDGHGNTIIAIDAQDTVTLNGVLKDQLHLNAFHIV